MDSFTGTFLIPNGEYAEINIKLLESMSKEDFKKELLKTMRPLLYSHHLDLILKNNSYENLYNIYNNGIEISREELGRIVWNKNKPKYKCISLEKEIIDCWGCKNDIANQGGHMNWGGCLYQSSED